MTLATSSTLVRTNLFGENLVQPPKPLFVNSGISGNTTYDLLSRIDRDCLSYHPDLTILMVGTNDMNSMKYIPLSQYESNMRLIISKILKIGSKILLMSILPVYEPYLYTRHKKEFYEPEGHQIRMKDMNILIRKLAMEYKLSFLDMHHIFNAVGNIGENENSLIRNMANSKKTDGVHPTANGYIVMAVAIYEHIIQSHLPYNRIVCFGDSITANGYPSYLENLLK